MIASDAYNSGPHHCPPVRVLVWASQPGRHDSTFHAPTVPADKAMQDKIWQLEVLRQDLEQERTILMNRVAMFERERVCQPLLGAPRLRCDRLWTGRGGSGQVNARTSCRLRTTPTTTADEACGSGYRLFGGGGGGIGSKRGARDSKMHSGCRRPKSTPLIWRDTPPHKPQDALLPG